jgi:hypothetical protein
MGSAEASISLFPSLGLPLFSHLPGQEVGNWPKAAVEQAVNLKAVLTMVTRSLPSLLLLPAMTEEAVCQLWLCGVSRSPLAFWCSGSHVFRDLRP